MKKGLKRKLVLTILAVGVLSVAIGLIATAWTGTVALRETLGENFEGLANETANKVDIAVAREVADLRHMRSAEAIRTAVMESSHRYEGIPEEEIIQELKRAVEDWEKSDILGRAKRLSGKASAFLIEAVTIGKKKEVQLATFVTDRRGVLVASTNPSIPYLHGQEDWWKSMMGMGVDDILLSNAYQDERTGHFVFDMAVPIFDREASSERIGALKIIFELKGFLTPLIDKTRFGQTGHAMLIDSGGIVLACPILPTGMHIPQEALTETVTSLKPGWIIAEDDAHGGKNSIVGFSPIEGVTRLSLAYGGNRWHSFIRQSPDETYAPIYSLVRAILYAGGLSIGFLVIVGTFVSKGLVRPIQLLQDGAEQIGRGALDHRLDIRTGDEIEHLAKEFNTMAARLKESYADLEEKVRDRTVELREMVERLEEMDRLKSEFLSNISHELRTPLTSIIGFSELLLDQTPGDLNQEQMEYIRNMFHSGHNLLEIISNLLDLSKIRAGRLEIHPGLFQIRHLINTAKMTVAPLMEKNGIHLEEEIEERLPEIYADEGKIRQVFLNLLSNAIKFTAEGGTIKISGRTVALGGESFAEISVADTGIGIRQEDLGMIFDEFRQVDASYTRDYPGTGLGLPITKHLVEMHGGRIWVESEPGRGSTFTFTLPLRIPVEGQTETKKISAEKTITRPPITGVKIEEGPATEDVREDAPKILVVEDDRQASQLITYYLTQEGYQVVHAYDGEEAIQKARELNPFAITLDIMLPRKDGWHVLQELQSMPEAKDIPVIILSMVENRELGFSLGAVDYLMKPFDRRALLNSLAKLDLESKAKHKPVTILVVEHDPQTLEEIKGILAETMLGVISASEIEEGITLALEGRPDIILLGLTSFSDRYGLDLPHRLMKYPIIKNIPIIVYIQEELSREMEERLEGEIRKIIHYKGQSIREDLLFEIKKYEKLYPDKARMIDGLTGLYNERYLRSRLADEVGRAFRYKRTFSLIAANIDHFREYNQRNGMEMGDKAFRDIADVFRQNLRSADSVCRFGGATFFVLMTETIKRPATLVAEKLRRLVESLSFQRQDGQVKEHLHISVGVATFAKDAKTGEGIIDKALNALEKAKREGGNRVVDAATILNEENHS
ncbi:MAG: diguanylate cyclase [Nitrospiria bacterium]